MSARYIALARVSSREQEREGFSLDVQEDALTRYAQKGNGTIIRMYRVAETASKREERALFKEALAYAREHAKELAGVLFYKVDRAARNLFDYVELERLEDQYGVPVIYVAQPTENTPAGRMMRRTLANMASFYTEQQSLDVREGMARRVENGFFIGLAPFGYKNVRVDGRGLIETDSENAWKVKRIYELYAYHGHTIDSLLDTLRDEGIFYSRNKIRFSRSTLHAILRDRAYIGEVNHRGNWYPGKQEALVDPCTWECVQNRLGEKKYRSLDLTYAGGIILCGHCGRPITGELKNKNTKGGSREYVYYRCAQYNNAGHPRTRVKESVLDQQVLALFDKIRIPDDKVRDWFGTVLKTKAKGEHTGQTERRQTIQSELNTLQRQKDKLLNLRLAEEIDSDTFSSKQAQIQKQIDSAKARIHVASQSTGNYAQKVIDTFELSQTLRQKWVTANIPQKRRLLDIVCLNYRLDGVSLIPTIRKPFDVLAKGVILENGRGDWI